MRLWRQAAIGAAFLLASACISEADGAVKALGPGHLYVTWKGWSRIRSPRPGSSRDSWTGKPSSALSRGLRSRGDSIRHAVLKLARSHSRSTFEHPRCGQGRGSGLREVGLIIRDIEVNAWGKTTDEAVGVDTIVRGVVRTCPSKWSVSRRGSSFWTVSTRG